MKTKERLAEALRQAHAPTVMIACAARGGYDDFEGKSDTPINDLVRDARMYGLHNIAERAIEGEFDATAEEADAWYEREGKFKLDRLNRRKV